ncbi:MAG: NAD(P)H-dependent oxidoreductase subunit E [Deltaproteobacteria bacterium]|nr:MAG: NAD(P)H-dependent oxidoreductase subunit E [Deltaproteobacteria bacterium]
MDHDRLEQIIERHGRDPAQLLAMLQDIQGEENYLPQEMLKELSKRLKVPLSRIYSLATFFSAFSLEPRGKHVCTVCMGTACHVRGAPRLVEQVERDFGIGPGQTTEDRKLTLETVNCVGACALGPLVILDGKYLGNMDASKMERALGEIKREQAGGEG